MANETDIKLTQRQEHAQEGAFQRGAGWGPISSEETRAWLDRIHIMRSLWFTGRDGLLRNGLEANNNGQLKPGWCCWRWREAVTVAVYWGQKQQWTHRPWGMIGESGVKADPWIWVPNSWMHGIAISWEGEEWGRGEWGKGVFVVELQESLW